MNYYSDTEKKEIVARTKKEKSLLDEEQRQKAWQARRERPSCKHRREVQGVCDESVKLIGTIDDLEGKEVIHNDYQS